MTSSTPPSAARSRLASAGPPKLSATSHEPGPTHPQQHPDGSICAACWLTSKTAPDTEQLFSSLLEVPLGHAHRPVNPMC